jgi:hypothetical protein
LREFEDAVLGNSEGRHPFEGYEADGIRWSLVEERVLRNRKRREAEKADISCCIYLLQVN